MTVVSRAAYRQLIEEDIVELHKLPDTLERRHIEDVLRWSISAIYDDPEFDRKYRHSGNAVSSETAIAKHRHRFVEARTTLDGVKWFTAACECGWRSNPKLTWDGMEDEIAEHVLEVTQP